MEVSKEIWDTLFEVAQEAAKADPETKTLDPLEDLRNGNKRIGYTRKEKQKKNNAFMEMRRKDLNWLSLLLDALWRLSSGLPGDKQVMRDTATVKRGHQTGSARREQMWLDFVYELRSDKAAVQGQDYSEAQLRHLPVLIALLSANGQQIKGCGTLTFYDRDTGEVLA